MRIAHHSPHKSWSSFFITLFWMVVGAFFTAVALEVFLIPNRIIDGGIVGIAIITSHVFGDHFFPLILVLMNLPFVILAFRNIGKAFVIQMFLSLLLLAGFVAYLQDVPAYRGEAIEVIFIGGLILGIGVGLIIRYGGAVDGTEIVAILMNRHFGYTVGQVILFFNIFIFALAGLVYEDWHTAVQSLMTYVIVIKIMDTVIVGFEETKAVWIISRQSQEISKAIVHEMGVGLTVLYGRGGFSGGEQEILYVIIERLQLAELKELVQRIDSHAFIAIENLHEVVNGRYEAFISHQNKRKPAHALKRLWDIRKAPL